MFNLSLGEIGSVNVVTSDKGGLSNDQIAEMAANKIVYVLNQRHLQLKNKLMYFLIK